VRTVHVFVAEQPGGHARSGEGEEAAEVMVAAVHCLQLVLRSHAAAEAAAFLAQHEVQQLLTALVLLNPLSLVCEAVAKLLRQLVLLGHEHRRSVLALLTKALPSVKLALRTVCHYFLLLQEVLLSPGPRFAPPSLYAAVKNSPRVSPPR
jgi:hypothetical protein